MNIMMGHIARREKIKINSSIFSKQSAIIRPKLILSVELSFSPRQDPFKLIYNLLIKSGFKSPEELKSRYPIPKTPLMCREISSSAKPFCVSRKDIDSILKAALLLGLCSKYQYSPSRAVIWTAASLNRRIELYKPGGFYA